VNSIMAACMLLAAGFPGGAVLLEALPCRVYLGPGRSVSVPLDYADQEQWWLELDWLEME